MSEMYQNNKEGIPVLTNPITYQKPGKEPEVKKLYLILWSGYYESPEYDNDPYQEYQFIEGTKQEVYDYIANTMLGYNADEETPIVLDPTKSTIIVDSENVKISDGISIYFFVKKQIDKNTVEENKEFNIEEFVPYVFQQEGEQLNE